MGFKHVRIHSFGYDSDWSKTSHSTLRIRDFAQALLASIFNSSILKKTKDVRPSKTEERTELKSRERGFANVV
jgi:hypothetical protein